MSGTAAPLPDDLIWYEGGQSGLELKLTFPAGGVPYTNLLLEAAGDLDTTGWGSRICRAEVVSAGAGVPCIQGSKGTINERFVLQKARGDSAFMDGVALDMGPSCGTTRTTSVPADYEVVVKVYYEMPLGQASFSDKERCRYTSDGREGTASARMSDPPTIKVQLDLTTDMLTPTGFVMGVVTMGWMIIDVPDTTSYYVLFLRHISTSGVLEPLTIWTDVI
ncbi:uncharacterized protein LOC122260730 [Penaeus japonicus]|uniref:uncharacterized protein LOC122260730 n=1 Tax=Penaeus japonicus TaxID=27405 RepID=UPI001C711ABE|nr:uncharacterized protein LOC122260730 [Penaeus japonicus]